MKLENERKLTEDELEQVAGGDMLANDSRFLNSLKGKAFSFVSISPIYEFSPVSLREGAVFLSIYSGHPTKKEDFDLLL